MTALEANGPFARQLSGIDTEGRFVLSVLVKRTYRIEPSGQCVLAEEQVPLTELPELGERAGLLLRDTDLYPMKPRTDVVVLGHAYAPHPTGAFDASIAVGGISYRMRVVGERRASLAGAGVTFSEPALIDDRIPLSFEHAYGGADRAAWRKHGSPLIGLAPHWPEVPGLATVNPYSYVRNPAGRGFLLEATAEAVDALTLPSLEDPGDLLTPERLAVGRMEDWIRQPLPRAPGWVSHGWFPRIGYMGFLPVRPALASDLGEVALGALPADVFELAAVGRSMSSGFANGAAPGLQCPHLRGDEEVSLICLSPRGQSVHFRLPGERPRLWSDGRKGRRNDTELAMHSLVVEPDHDRATLLWRGSAPALRPYSSEELQEMPFWIQE